MNRGHNETEVCMLIKERIIEIFVKLQRNNSLRPWFHSASQSNEKVILYFLVAGIFSLAKANVIQIVYILITLEI